MNNDERGDIDSDGNFIASGVEVYQPKGRPKRIPCIDTAMRIAAWLDNGVSWPKIADNLGISVSTARKWYKDLPAESASYSPYSLTGPNRNALQHLPPSPEMEDVREAARTLAIRAAMDCLRVSHRMLLSADNAGNLKESHAACRSVAKSIEVTAKLLDLNLGEVSASDESGVVEYTLVELPGNGRDVK